MGYRYIGSKEKLAEVIIMEIKNIKPDAKRVIDLMAGTGLFSQALRRNGYKITASDVMTYSYHHLQVQLRLSKAPQFNKLVSTDYMDFNSSIKSKKYNNRYSQIISHLNELEPIEGYFFKEFSPEGLPKNGVAPRKYFTSENAKKIDSIRLEIKRLNKDKLLEEVEYSLLLHDLIMAVNDIANIAGTYGHHLSKFIGRANQPIVLKESSFLKLKNIDEHHVHRGFAEDLAKNLEGDICYIDPPYIKRQYAANYHVLETLARGDEPEAVGVSGLRPWRDQYSNFCSKIKIRNSFDKIITNLKCSDILISYSEDGLLNLEELIQFLSDYGKVSKKSVLYKRFKSNNSKKTSVLEEYLIHLRKH